MSAKDQPLRVEVKGGRLIISIGVDSLAFSANQWESEQAFARTHGKSDAPSFKVADAVEWAKDVSSAIQDEAENGSTPLTDFFDEMFQEALNSGALGVEHLEGNVEGNPQ